eukprot:tig00000128_g7202.t1
MRGTPSLGAFVPDLVRHRWPWVKDEATEAAEPQLQPFEGVCCIVDISGSVALAQVLQESSRPGPFDLADQQPARGADELSARINGVFQEVLEVSRRYRADALRFLGDSVLLMVYAEAAGGAAGAARAAAEMAGALLAACTGSLAVHLAVTGGRFFPLRLGGYAGKFEACVVGEPLGSLEAGLSRAKAGEVSISAAVLRLLGIDSAARSPEAGGRSSGRPLARASSPPSRGRPPRPHRPGRGLNPRGRGRAGRLRAPDVEAAVLARSGFLKELRIITSLFLRYDAFRQPRGGRLEPAAVRALALFVSAAQEAAARTGGVVRSFFCDDKGFVGLVSYGLLAATHTDDPLRACAFAVRVREALRRRGLGAASASIGIATGRVFAGIVGDERRCEYSVLGDAVNTAARLMAAAHGETLVDEATREAVGPERVQSEAVAPLSLKGKRAPVEAFRLTGSVRRGGADSAAIRSIPGPALGPLATGEESDWEAEAGAGEGYEFTEKAAEGEKPDGPAGPGPGTPRGRAGRSLLVLPVEGAPGSGSGSGSGSLKRRLGRSSSTPALAAQLAARLRAEAASRRSRLRGRPAAADALADGGGVLLVTGEGGAGKSAVGRECRRLADAVEIPYLAACGDPLESSRPFHAFGGLLCYLVDLLDPARPASAAPPRPPPRAPPACRSSPPQAAGRGGAGGEGPASDGESETPVGSYASEALPCRPPARLRGLTWRRRRRRQARARAAPRRAPCRAAAWRPRRPLPALAAPGAGTAGDAIAVMSLPVAARPVPSQYSRAGRFIGAVDPTLATPANAAALEELLQLESDEEGGEGEGRAPSSQAPRPQAPPLFLSRSAEGALAFLSDLLAAALRALRAVLIAEDGHAMDSASLRLLANLAAAPGVSVLVTARPGPPLDADLAALRSLGRARALELAPLSPDQSAELLAGKLGVAAEAVPRALAEALCEAARGNAFAISEMAGYLVRRGLLAVRAGPALEVARGVLEAAGEGPTGASPARGGCSPAPACSGQALGPRFAVALAVHVLGEDAEEAALLEDLRTVRPAAASRAAPAPPQRARRRAGRQLEGARGFVAEALYRMLGEGDRQRLHRRAVAWLTSDAAAAATAPPPAPPSSPARVAGLEHVDGAAERAHRIGAFAEAAALARQARPSTRSRRGGRPSGARSAATAPR